MIVVNLWAGPSAGKTTGAAYIFSQLKMNGINAELVTDHPKELAWEGRLPPFPTDYVHLLAEQYHRLWRLKDKVDIAITDSPLPLAIIYGPQNATFNNFAMYLYTQFDNRMDFFVIRKKEYKQEGRHIDESAALNVDKQIRTLLYNEGIPSTDIPGNQHGYGLALLKILRALK